MGDMVFLQADPPENCRGSTNDSCFWMILFAWLQRAFWVLPSCGPHVG